MERKTHMGSNSGARRVTNGSDRKRSNSSSSRVIISASQVDGVDFLVLVG